MNTLAEALAEEEFKEKGYVQIKNVFPEILDSIRRECIAEFSGDYVPHSAPFVGTTVVHKLDLKDTFILNLLLKSPSFIKKIRSITGVPDLVVVDRDPSEPYQPNLYSSKLALYYTGGTSLHPHFDRMVFQGAQIALVYTVLSSHGDPMKIKMQSRNPAGALNDDTFELVGDSLTLHDAKRVFHTVQKPDEQTQRIAFMLQFTNRGLKPKKGPMRVLSVIQVGLKILKARAGFI